MVFAPSRSSWNGVAQGPGELDPRLVQLDQRAGVPVFNFEKASLFDDDIEERRATQLVGLPQDVEIPGSEIADARAVRLERQPRERLANSSGRQLGLGIEAGRGVPLYRRVSLRLEVATACLASSTKPPRRGPARSSTRWRAAGRSRRTPSRAPTRA
jgi:hypothetical protein